MTFWTCIRSCGRMVRVGEIETVPPECPCCGRRMGRENKPRPKSETDADLLAHDRAAARRLGL